MGISSSLGSSALLPAGLGFRNKIINAMLVQQSTLLPVRTQLIDGLITNLKQASFHFNKTKVLLLHQQDFLVMQVSLLWVLIPLLLQTNFCLHKI
jgi:hypothetical protein